MDVPQYKGCVEKPSINNRSFSIPVCILTTESDVARRNCGFTLVWALDLTYYQTQCSFKLSTCTVTRIGWSRLGRSKSIPSLVNVSRDLIYEKSRAPIVVILQGRGGHIALPYAFLLTRSRLFGWNDQLCLEQINYIEPNAECHRTALCSRYHHRVVTVVNFLERCSSQRQNIVLFECALVPSGRRDN